MLVQRDILLQMMEDVETFHQQIFWYVFMHSGKCSEYELYVRYSLWKYPTRTRIRNLNFINTGNCSFESNGQGPYDYVSCHSHMKKIFLEEHPTTAH